MAASPVSVGGLDGLAALLPPAGAAEGAGPVTPAELVGAGSGDGPVVLSLVRHFG